jgi:hypothetical protein
MHGGGFCFARSRAGLPDLTKYPLARNSDGPGAARRQPAPLSHPASIPRRSRVPNPAPNPNRPNHTAPAPEGKHGHTRASMATRPRPAHRPAEAPAQARKRKPNPALARAQLPRTSQRATPCPSMPRPRPPGPPRALPQRCAGTHVQSKSSASAQCPRSRSPSLRHAATHTP